MKILQLLIICLFTTSFLFAQDCVHNPSVQAGDLDPAPLYPGVIGKTAFTFFENLTSYEDWDTDPVTMTVCMLNIKPLNGAESVTENGPEWFNWIYDESTNCLLATQNKTIVGGQGVLINVEFEVTNPVECDVTSQMGFNVNIQPAACMNTTNLAEDDDESVYTCYDPNGVPTSIQNRNELDLDVLLYPNPATDQITLESVTPLQDLDVVILDILGKEVKGSNKLNIGHEVNNINIDVAELSVGTYFLTLYNEDGNRSTFKFVKTNK